MLIYNSYTDQLEEFIPKHKDEVNIYVCGPTVYNFSHIGNARPPVFFDTLRRYLEAKNYKVKFVSNFTDVDDKIIKEAIKEGKSEKELSSFYIDAFLKDIKSLNCKTDYIKPKVTDYMPDIIDYIKNLVDKGYAYVVDGDVYFEVSKIKDYGHLANRNLEDLVSGSRVDLNPLKKNPLDFTLWKKTDEGIKFDSPFSKGRPGWHTECVVMINSIFKEEIDIHGGGVDLKFPHHENEIAQAKATNNNRLAKFWMHNGRLDMTGSKMSKSLGNVILTKDFTEKMPLRYFLLSTHYRQPLNYDDKTLQMYIKEWEKLQNTVKSLFLQLDLNDELNENIKINNKEIIDEMNNFDDSMEQDFNTANAITALQSLLKITNISLRNKANFNLLNQYFKAINYMCDILGFDIRQNRMSEENKKLYIEWQNSRKNKDFEKADKLRKELSDRGIL